MKLRRECKVCGPICFLFESAHVNASALTQCGIIKQINQPDIDIINCPIQDLKPILKQALKRNRTKAAEEKREECEGLGEIDEYATKAAAKNIKDRHRVLLDVVRAGGGPCSN